MSGGKLGAFHPLLIGESELQTGKEVVSRNPARPDEVVGRLEIAGQAEVDMAIGAAVAAFADWSEATVETRAGIIDRAADFLVKRRFELAALEVYETGQDMAGSGCGCLRGY